MAQCRGVSLGACSLRHEPTRQRRWPGRPLRGGTRQHAPACGPSAGPKCRRRAGMLLCCARRAGACASRRCHGCSMGGRYGPAVAHPARVNPLSEACTRVLSTLFAPAMKTPGPAWVRSCHPLLRLMPDSQPGPLSSASHFLLWSPAVKTSSLFGCIPATRCAGPVPDSLGLLSSHLPPHRTFFFGPLP